MPNTKDIDLQDRIMALLIAAPGQGKTLAGASWAEAGSMEFIDFDGRMKPVRLHYPKADINYTSFSMQNLEQFAYKYLPDLVKYCPYKSVQLAGITSLSTVAISYQMDQMRGGDGLKKTKGGLMVPSWDQFNGEAMIIGQVLDMLRALPCNVFVEAHPVSRINATTGEKFTSLVAFGPKVESLVPGYFDEIWYFTTEVGIQGERQYVVHTRPSNDYPMAKTSLPLPPKMVLSDQNMKPISLYKLVQHFLNKHKEEEDALNITDLSETMPDQSFS